jgi:hypothetical protein
MAPPSSSGHVKGHWVVNSPSKALQLKDITLLINIQKGEDSFMHPEKKKVPYSSCPYPERGVLRERGPST